MFVRTLYFNVNRWVAVKQFGTLLKSNTKLGYGTNKRTNNLCLGKLFFVFLNDDFLMENDRPVVFKL